MTAEPQTIVAPIDFYEFAARMPACSHRGPDLRAHPRRLWRVPASLFRPDHGRGWIDALTLDISLGGCGVLTAVSIPVDERVVLALPDVPGSPAVEAFVRACAEVHPQIQRVGLEFLPQDPL